MNEGWIKISRAITRHWLWQDAERLKWWIYLLLNAQWETQTTVCGNQLVEVRRGQLVQSVRGLAKIWGVGKQRAFNFIELLQKDGMVSVQQIGHQYTIITICNYESYQDTQDTAQDTNEDADKTRSGQNKKKKEKTEEKNQKKKENKQRKDKEGKEISVLSSSYEEYKPLQKSGFCGSADFFEKAKKVWEEYYQWRTGMGYYWTNKDTKLMRELVDKVSVNTPESKRTEKEVLGRLGIFLRNTEDKWTNERLSVQIVNMKFNELMQQLKAKKKAREKENGVGGVDFRPARI